MNCNDLVNDSNLDRCLHCSISNIFIGVSVKLYWDGVEYCRKKTNFLVRRMVYTIVPTTLQYGALWFWSIPGFKRDDSNLY